MRQSRKGNMFTTHTARTVLEFGGLAFLEQGGFAREGGVFGSDELPQQAAVKLKVWHILNVKQELKNQLTRNLNLHI